VRTCNELDRLAAARPRTLARTEDVVDAAEAERLLRQIVASAPAPRRARSRAPGRGLTGSRRAGLLAAGLGATAVAVTVAVVLSSGTTPAPSADPTPVPGTPRATAVPPGQSARQVLLAYATAAARAPATTGKYWYVHATFLSGFPDTFDTWMLRNGVNWVRAYKTHNRVIKLPWAGPGWELEGSPLFGLRFKVGKRPSKPSPNWPGQVTFRQLQRLPATPAALKAWIVAFDRDFTESMGGTPVYPGEGVFVCLTSLIADLPAPPLVRAAAFRVLATLPNIGRVDGGRGLRFGLGRHGYATLVVEPATSALRDILIMSSPNGRPLRLSVTARWENRLPPVSHTHL
jgi:hypothetical protein